MIDILLLCEQLDPSALRGVATLKARLSRRGFRLQVLCADASGPLPADLDLVECPGLSRPWRRDLSIRALPMLNDGRPDLLHVHGFPMAEAGLSMAEHGSLPYLLTIHKFLPPRARLRLSRRWARGIIATEPDLAIELRGQYGVPEDWIHAIPAGIELPDLSERAHPADRIPVVGTTMLLERGSGIPIFLEAVRNLIKERVNVEFVINGQHGCESALRKLVTRVGVADRVTFSDDLEGGPDLWTVVDVFCQVSLGPDSGRLLGDALAHGVPCVASDVPGLRSWIVPGQTGILTPPEDSSALADAIRRLLDDRDEAVRYGQRAREWIARHHDPERESDALADLYRLALDGRSPAESPGMGVSVEPLG